MWRHCHRTQRLNHIRANVGRIYSYVNCACAGLCVCVTIVTLELFGQFYGIFIRNGHDLRSCRRITLRSEVRSTLGCGNSAQSNPDRIFNAFFARHRQTAGKVHWCDAIEAISLEIDNRHNIGRPKSWTIESNKVDRMNGMLCANIRWQRQRQRAVGPPHKDHIMTDNTPMTIVMCMLFGVFLCVCVDERCHSNLMVWSETGFRYRRSQLIFEKHKPTISRGVFRVAVFRAKRNAAHATGLLFVRCRPNYVRRRAPSLLPRWSTWSGDAFGHIFEAIIHIQ